MTTTNNYILGISAYYHDSAATLLHNGHIVGAVQEERFTRKKHDARFPANAIAYLLKSSQIKICDVSVIVFYDKPLIKFERLLETYLAYAPKGFGSFVRAMPLWLKEKLFLKTLLKKEIAKHFNIKQSQIPKILFTEHHQSHAASAFYPSPFQKAAVICLDGVGEWASTSVWLGENNKLSLQWEINFPHSLGLLYSAFTYFTGFKVNSGEYKLMGLAPYGEPKYVDAIYKNLIDVKPDGTFRLNMDYFEYPVGLKMTNLKFNQLFGGPPRNPDEPITQREMDLAKSIQVVTEEIVLKLAQTVFQELKVDYLCMAGGVALNCVANGKLLKEGPFKKIWIQPAAGDAGGSLGAALSAWHGYFNQERIVQSSHDAMKGSYLGPEYSNEEIKSHLDLQNLEYKYLPDGELFKYVASALSKEKVVGWFQGKMEFGPRALGNRSILGDARSKTMQSTMNLKIKFRESFRPFAPAVLREDLNEYFDINQDSPYMLFVANVQPNLRSKITDEEKHLFGIEKLKIPKSIIPAVTHLDFSARIQTVHEETNDRFYFLIKEFKKQTQCSVLVNTSFNVRGEPIVCSPQDAIKCFLRTDIDCLVLGNYVVDKTKQNVNAIKDKSWMKEYELD